MVKHDMRDTNLERLRWLDVLKGFGIIYVVVAHFWANDVINNWIQSFHMPLFFFASGYLYRRRPVFVLMKHRFRTIIVPYFVFGIVSQIYYVLTEMAFSRDINIFKVMMGLVYGAYASIPYNRVLWFLPTMYVITNLYNIFMNIDYKLWGGRRITIIMVLAASVFYVSQKVTNYLPWGIDNKLCQYIFYYMVGNIFAERKMTEKIISMSMSWKFIMATVLAGGNCILISYRQPINMHFIALIGVVGWLVISVIVEEYANILVIIGQASLCILCLHVPVCNVITKVLVRMTIMTFESAQSNVYHAMIRIILTIAICVYMNLLISKTVPWMLGKRERSSGSKKNIIYSE